MEYLNAGYGLFVLFFNGRHSQIDMRPCTETIIRGGNKQLAIETERRYLEWPHKEASSWLGSTMLLVKKIDMHGFFFFFFFFANLIFILEYAKIKTKTNYKTLKSFHFAYKFKEKE